MKNKGSANFFFWGGGGGEGANKVHYGRCASGQIGVIDSVINPGLYREL